MKKSQYKVGDSVKLVYNLTSFPEENLGRIVTINTVHDSYVTFTGLYGGGWCAIFDDIRPLTKLDKALA